MVMALNWRNLLPQWLRSTEPPKAHPIESPSTEIFISRQSITRCVFDNAEEKKKANAPIVLEWNNIATILKSTFETPFSQEQQAIIEAIENIAARIEASNDFDRFISFQRNDIQTLRNNCALIYEAKNTILDKKRGLPINWQAQQDGDLSNRETLKTPMQ